MTPLKESLESTERVPRVTDPWYFYSLNALSDEQREDESGFCPQSVCKDLAGKGTAADREEEWWTDTPPPTPPFPELFSGSLLHSYNIFIFIYFQLSKIPCNCSAD